MKYMNNRHFFVVFWFLITLLLIGPAEAPAAAATTTARTIFIFGDSWVEDITTTSDTTTSIFDQALIDRGYDSFVTTQVKAFSGSTMAGWAADNPCGDCPGELTTLAQAITSDPNPDPIVFFILGGNDVRDSFANSGPNQTIYDTLAQDLRTILDTLTATRSDVRIVVGAYDILNPAIDPFCSVALQLVFGSADPAIVNPYVNQIYTTYETIAAEYTNVVAVNTMGTLQGTPGDPDLSQWSAVQYVADCIHLTESGYKLYLAVIFDEVLIPSLGDPIYRTFLPLVLENMAG